MNDDVEIWKPLPFAPQYEISSFGRIKSNNFITPRILTQKTCKTGYKSIGLCVNKQHKFFLVHRLVLMVFNPCDGMEKLEVNHIDEDKSNNHLSNLEWVTSKENCNYGNRNGQIHDKSTKLRVRCIETGVVYESCKQAHDLTGVCRATLCGHLQGKFKRAMKLHWEVTNDDNE